jgi:uncharacterized protein YjbI with pentapeptide repeats
MDGGGTSMADDYRGRDLTSANLAGADLSRKDLRDAFLIVQILIPPT